MEGQGILVSQKFWDDRYSSGMTSGDNGAGPLKDWQWEVLTKVAGEIDDVIDVGCGDLRFWQDKDGMIRECKKYTGIDISQFMIEKHSRIFKIFDRPEWTFIHSPADVYIEGLHARIVVCLNMLYHILNEDVFNNILKNLSLYSDEWVFINTWEISPWEDKTTDNYYQKYWALDKYVVPGFTLADKHLFKMSNANIFCTLCFKKMT